jgi:hypothetical protein
MVYLSPRHLRLHVQCYNVFPLSRIFTAYGTVTMFPPAFRILKFIVVSPNIFEHMFSSYENPLGGS